jgi:hypothetical protein
MEKQLITEFSEIATEPSFLEMPTADSIFLVIIFGCKMISYAFIFGDIFLTDKL